MSLRTKIPTRPSPHTTNYPITTGTGVPATTAGRFVTHQELSGLIGEVGKINQALYTYPQLETSASAKSDADIWRHIDTWIWGKTGEKTAIKPMFEERFELHGTKLDEAAAHRKKLHEKIDSAVSEHSDIWSSISQKADNSHVHANGHSTDCGWFGEKCWLDGLGWVKWVALGAVALLVLWLVRPLLKIGANVTK